MSKGSQKNRPVDRDLEENMRGALSSEGDSSRRTPWFAEQPVPSREARTPKSHPQDFVGGGNGDHNAGILYVAEEWRNGCVAYASGESAPWQVLCMNNGVGAIVPFRPIVRDGCYILRYQHGDDPITYVYARVEAVDAISVEGE